MLAATRKRRQRPLGLGLHHLRVQVPAAAAALVAAGLASASLSAPLLAPLLGAALLALRSHQRRLRLSQRVLRPRVALGLRTLGTAVQLEAPLDAASCDGRLARARHDGIEQPEALQHHVVRGDVPLALELVRAQVRHALDRRGWGRYQRTERSLHLWPRLGPVNSQPLGRARAYAGAAGRGEGCRRSADGVSGNSSSLGWRKPCPINVLEQVETNTLQSQSAWFMVTTTTVPPTAAAA